MVYQDKDVETNRLIIKDYKIRAYPTFVVADADGKELSRSVGAPFSSAKDGVEWVGKISKALDDINPLEKTYKEKPEDTDTALKLADTYKALGKTDEAKKLYEAALKKLDKEDKLYADAKLAYADLLYAGFRRNPREIGPKVTKIYEEILPGLLENKDDRAIEAKLRIIMIKVSTDRDFTKARTEFQALVKLFPKSDRVPEFKYFAAACSAQLGDMDTAITEFDAIVKDGPKDDAWVKRAKQSCENLKKRRDASKKK